MVREIISKPRTRPERAPASTLEELIAYFQSKKKQPKANKKANNQKVLRKGRRNRSPYTNGNTNAGIAKRSLKLVQVRRALPIAL